jgi:nucleoside-diphosphate-sugar epimerase
VPPHVGARDRRSRVPPHVGARDRRSRVPLHVGARDRRSRVPPHIGARVTVLALVGGAGFIGSQVARLLTAEKIGHVVLDRREVDLTAADARATLAAHFARTRTTRVIHLAARVDPATPGERAAMRRLHVDGTRAVVDAANDARVEKLVLVSSATVHGAWPHNPVPLTEDAPLLPNPGFAYGEDKCAQERIVAAFPRTAIARPAIVYGRGAKNYLTEILRRAPVLPALDGHRPPLQFVHVDDVARALVALATTDVTGAFGVASDWLAFDEVARVARKRIVTVPSRLVGGPLDALARILPPHLRAPRTMLPYLTHPFVVSSAKLTRETGWRAQHTTADALASILRD